VEVSYVEARQWWVDGPGRPPPAQEAPTKCAQCETKLGELVFQGYYCSIECRDAMQVRDALDPAHAELMDWFRQ